MPLKTAFADAGVTETSRLELEECIAGRAFTLAYQPILHLESGSVVGVEALCRFTDGASTERRFQDAERLGLAPELDLAIIETVLGQLTVVPDGYVSINLSPSTVSDGRLGEALLGGGVATERVVVEVTEHARIPDYERADRLLATLRAAGIRLAVDDAGAGYATFRHILALRPDMIKMDRSITENIDSDTARRALATALVIFGAEIGATVIAEGVETQAEIVALRRAGIPGAQGYALARPSPLPLPPVLYEPLALTDLPDAVERVRLAAETLRTAQAALDEAVVHARRGGATWGDLGRELRMTRQGASRRYRHLRSEKTKPR